MSHKKHFTNELANTFLASDWTHEDLSKRLTTSLGFLPTWGEPLLGPIQQRFENDFPEIKPKELSRYISEHPLFNKAWREHRHSLIIRSYNLELPASSHAALNCDVPLLKTARDLADWFGISMRQLDGFSDTWGLERKSALLQQRHYHYQWKHKHIGADRLLEIPKTNLRTIQRKIHSEILQQIPLHPACHGFRKGHSCLTFVQNHCAKPVVIRIDLQRFFTSIPLRRIHAIFESIGYHTAVARIFAGLCTNQVPQDILHINTKLGWYERKQYATPHLPQGAPVSPALANLAAFKLDLRLSQLMKTMDGEYTRYADDLAFSGDFSRTTINQLHALIYHIVMDEGFSLNTRKTRIMRRGRRQQLTGLVLNQHPNYPRFKYDKLKAILYNCSRFGPASQNQEKHEDFKSHLQGKIAHVKSINPQRAIRLERLFAEIDWEARD